MLSNSKTKLWAFIVLGCLFVQEVKSSSIKLSSINAKDHTTAFKRAMASEYDTLIIDSKNSTWVVRPLTFFGIKNKTLLFEPGVNIEAEKGAYGHKGASLMTFIDSNDIRLIGSGNLLAMNKEEYVTGEFRHILAFRGCSNVRVCDLKLTGSGGDGIIISRSQNRPYSEDIFIEEVHSINNKRQGISIISAQNIFITNCVFADTKGTLPGAGVDLEPDRPNQRLVNIHFTGCTFKNNYHAGIKVELDNLTRESEPVSLFFDRCEIRDNFSPDNPRPKAEIFMGSNRENPVTGVIQFKNCLIENSSWSFFYGRNMLSDLKVKFEDCEIRNIRTENNKGIIRINQIVSPQNNVAGGLIFEKMQYELKEQQDFLFTNNSKAHNLWKGKIQGTMHVNTEHQSDCRQFKDQWQEVLSELNIICSEK